MDPLSIEVITAVHDLQEDARRRMDYSGIYADRIKTEAALFNDAVLVFSIAFRESNSVRGIDSMSLRCTESKYTETEKWEHGMEILQMMDQVLIHIIFLKMSIL